MVDQKFPKKCIQQMNGRICRMWRCIIAQQQSTSFIWMAQLVIELFYNKYGDLSYTWCKKVNKQNSFIVPQKYSHCFPRRYSLNLFAFGNDECIRYSDCCFDSTFSVRDPRFISPHNLAKNCLLHFIMLQKLMRWIACIGCTQFSRFFREFSYSLFPPNHGSIRLGQLTVMF